MRSRLGLAVTAVVLLSIAGLVAVAVRFVSGSDTADEARPLPAELLATGSDGVGGISTIATIEGTHVSAALEESSREGRYTVLYFLDSRRPGTRETADKAASLAGKLPRQVAWVEVDVRDAKARPVLRKYGIRAEPTTLVLAPNGAVTTGFTGPVSHEKLHKGLASPKMEEILKAIQEEKVVFLAFVGPALAESQTVRQAVREAGAQMAGITQSVEVDPADSRETRLLDQCGVSPDATVAETLVISPRGTIAQRFRGAMTPQHLYDSFQRILSQASGCGSRPITGGSACQPARGAAGESTCNE